MQNSKISVIVPVFNNEKTIKACINSLINQNLNRKKYEIVIIDNNSSDNSVKILNKFDNRIKIFYQPKKGAYNARNLGIEKSSGQIIAFTDSDCIADNNWLYYVTRPLSNKNIKLVGGITRAMKKENYIQKYYDICNWQNLSYNSKIPFFGGANMAAKKKDLEKIEMFNPNIESGGDVELCSRLVENKNNIFFEPRAIVKHFYHGSIKTFIQKNFYYGKWHKFMRNELRLKHHLENIKYHDLIKNHGIRYIPIRLLQDISFKSGLIFGNIK